MAMGNRHFWKDMFPYWAYWAWRNFCVPKNTKEYIRLKWFLWILAGCVLWLALAGKLWQTVENMIGDIRCRHYQFDGWSKHFLSLHFFMSNSCIYIDPENEWTLWKRWNSKDVTTMEHQILIKASLHASSFELGRSRTGLGKDEGLPFR